MGSVGSVDGARILINSGSQFTRVAEGSGRLVCADDTARESPRAASGGGPKGQHPRNLSGIRDRAGQAALEPARGGGDRGGLPLPASGSPRGGPPGGRPRRSDSGASGRPEAT